MIKHFVFLKPTDSKENMLKHFNLHNPLLTNDRTTIYQNDTMRFSIDESVVRVTVFKTDDILIDKLRSFFYGKNNAVKDVKAHHYIISALLFFSPQNHTSNLIVMNIYKIEDPKILSVCYKIINSVNLTITGGSFSITEGEKQQIIYRNTIDCAFGLESEMISKQLNDSIVAIEKLFELLILRKGEK